jgi:hypothetical protein
MTDSPVAVSSITNPAAFKAALLQALMEQNTEALQRLMSAEVLVAGWRADGAYTAPADALQTLYTHELQANPSLEWVQDADLFALLGDRDPLAFVRSDAGVFEAALLRGWGKDGRDEAILFLARDPDQTLKWHGWIRINGGFSGARLGGNQLYTNAANGFRFFLPKDVEVQETSADTALFLAPGEGHPGEGRAAAFLEIQPASGRTVDAITEQVKTDLGPGFDVPPGTALALDKATAIVLTGLPGQDANRQVFVVYHDRLFHLTFVPNTPQAGDAYTQMEDLYAMIVNTFTFTE